MFEGKCTNLLTTLLERQKITDYCFLESSKPTPYSSFLDRQYLAAGGSMGKHLVLAGGGHAHMTVLLRLGDFTGKGHRVTVISPSAYHYYSGMGPGMLSGMYEPREIRFNIRKMAVERGASFIEDSAVRIDPGAKTILLASGGETPYDVASFNTGSRVPVECLSPGRNGTMIPVKPIINLYRACLEILREIGRRGLHFPGRTPSGQGRRLCRSPESGTASQPHGGP